MEKVRVTSNANARVVVVIRDYNFNRAWPSRGSSVMIDMETLENIIYDVGFRNMLLDGTLVIDDMDVKIKLGLEPDGAEEPVNIIVLSEAEQRRLMREASIAEFEEYMHKLSYRQRYDLAEYATHERLVDIDKCNLLKKYCGKDVLRAIQLADQNKEN